MSFAVGALEIWASYGFIAVYAVEQFHLPDSVAAIYTGILYVASVVGYGVGAR